MDHLANFSDISANAVLAAHGKSFHWARHLLGPIHAERATRLYAFCRWIDDLADTASSPHDARQELLSIKQQIRTVTKTNTRVNDMLDLMRDCSIDPDVVGELIDGVASDFAHVPFLDQEMLLRYCYRVAGTVGLMMCRVLDVSDQAANYYAIDLGIGMQLTNICRDVSEDAAADRRYIPMSLIGDIKPQRLIDPAPELQPIIAQSVKHLLELADDYYESGEAGLAYLPLQARMGIRVAGKVYQAIGIRLRRRHYACWKGRVRVNSFAKSAITLSSLASLLVRPALWQLPQDHNHFLHTALRGLPYTDRRG